MSETADGCLEWTGRIDRNGYGRRSGQMAYRIAYEDVNGPVPEGMDLDHLCRNRACVNPAHLEPVTHHENILRGDSPTAQNARKDRCVNGHELDHSNTYVRPDGAGRQCKACQNEASRRWREKRLGVPA